ncbi:MAG: sugar isomerase domain-containing protein [Treponema sp.]|jgi:uncharacterized phosphosugar-binding protein|nr:sugar isomerase domain-containing protein [Treponema sp.]
MLVDGFYDYCRKLLDDIQRDEAANLEKAAEMIAQAVAKGHNFFIHDRGHCIGGELLARAGGAVFVRRLDVAIPDPSLLAPHTGSRKASRDKLSGDALVQRKRKFETEYVDYVFDINGLAEGDVLFLNSNSGFGFAATNVAAAAKRKGLKLIVMSSGQTSRAVTPEGGDKKLAEYADILFDNHAPYGDAVYEVKGLEEKLWPASGMGAAFIAWPLILRTIEKLLEKGVNPSVFRSANIPGGPDQNVAVSKHYEEFGY